MLSPVRNLADAVERLSACESEIRDLGVQRLALFGSVLHGRPGPDSDADLLVQFRPGAKTYGRFLTLADLLERELGRRVELVTTEALSPYIGPRILAEAEDVIRAA
jgi:predicted nucleotidyltransferase